MSDPVAAMLNDNLDGWNRAMGLRFVKASADEVVAEVPVDDRHRQPYGLVHGGVYAGIVETTCSVGAALHALPSGRSTVGLENSTSFLHGTRGGTLTVTARPVSRGSRTQVWEATVSDDTGRAVATGRVRLLCLDPGAAVAGRTVKLEP
jgi:uncharacterized protein (TIGR00369 family)